MTQVPNSVNIVFLRYLGKQNKRNITSGLHVDVWTHTRLSSLVVACCASNREVSGLTPDQYTAR